MQPGASATGLKRRFLAWYPTSLAWMPQGTPQYIPHCDTTVCDDDAIVRRSLSLCCRNMVGSLVSRDELTHHTIDIEFADTTMGRPPSIKCATGA